MEIYPEVLLWESVPDNINRPSLVILNLPISDIRILELLWTRTGFKICADGGANRLFDAFDDVEEVRRSSFVGTQKQTQTENRSCRQLRFQVQYTAI